MRNDLINELIEKMTLEEKATLCSGKDFWHMNGCERVGVPSIMITDGPHGLRKQAESADHLGINKSVPSTCFPPACLSACSWDEEALESEGVALAEECIEEEVAIILGPGTNIKRSPLCGRNFEYFSEDPYLSGKMAAALIRGVESKGIGTSLKHYAGNSQEKVRLAGNSIIDERALREIYLPAFEAAVKEGRPTSLMCAYNRVNGVYACENERLLTTILREEWGYDGFVMTDWGAMNERVEALKAGLELEMPGPCPENTSLIVEAVRNGSLDEAVLDKAVGRLLKAILRSEEVERSKYDRASHHQLGRKIAASSMVLLKNDGALPLSKEGRYGVIGAFAKTPRYQGAGSSKINPNYLDNAYDELISRGYDAEYAAGYDPITGETNDALLEEAIRAARGKRAAIIFAGLPAKYESEGFDRTTMALPDGHNRLIEEVAKVCDRVIVVLYLGSAVELPWRASVSSILLSYLPGEAAGSATVDILSGEVNPSGKLAETFPIALEDVPSNETFGKADLDVLYKESILVGYRYYDWAGLEVAFPFGHGLSYTAFEYSDLKVEENKVTFTIENVGDVAGAEIAELYIGKKDSAIFRAARELKGFKKVFLKAGEKRSVELPLTERSFSYYDVEKKDWNIEDGEYEIYIGSSSRDIRLTAKTIKRGEAVAKAESLYSYTRAAVLKAGRISISDERFATLFKGRKLPLSPKYDCIHLNSTVAEVLSTKGGQAIFKPMLENALPPLDPNDEMSIMMNAMMMDMPLRGLSTFSSDVTRTLLNGLIEQINQINNA